ncbi:MAG: hypothetical protein HRU20_09130 [Pseudomonadales bacterium]|nr:hypothetical protein [Pseudomonadales bacterium]
MNRLKLIFAPSLYSKDDTHISQGVLLQIFEPNQMPLPDAKSIRAIFQITQKKSEVCEMLIAGHTLK